MPKIIKNGLVYSGVPDEVVTAWETEDVQDIDEPTMGDTDISGIGDGSITGAIGSLNGRLNGFTSGDVTWNTTNVNGDVDRKRWQKNGNIVIAGLEFTPLSGKIVSGNVICTDLPIPRDHKLTVFSTHTNQMKINELGELIWYFPSNTTDLQRCDVSLVYFV